MYLLLAPWYAWHVVWFMISIIISFFFFLSFFTAGWWWWQRCFEHRKWTKRLELFVVWTSQVFGIRKDFFVLHCCCLFLQDVTASAKKVILCQSSPFDTLRRESDCYSEVHCHENSLSHWTHTVRCFSRSAFLFWVLLISRNSSSPN